MSKLKVVEVHNDEWSNIVAKCINYDFYHTQSYHKLEQNNRPVLLSLNVEGNTIALPIIVRSIPNTEWFDCTSAYGYCGPISSLDIKNIPLEQIDLFRRELISFFKQSNIVSTFSRLHPLIESQHFFTDFGVIRNLNKTVAIDLHLAPDEQRKQYRKSNKSELNQLRRKGFEVVEARTEDEIDNFIEIYTETMERVNAVAMYFFDRDYFFRFLKSTDFNSKLLVAKFEGKITAGAIFTITNGMIQYHLAGTTEEFIKVTPMKLILDEARLLGNELNLDYLHLGGGVGGSDEDPLFRFKSGFSNLYCQYRVWQLIIDRQKYDELVVQNNATEKGDFFPLYRST
jgi:lipid II:glycine glycyltransferase (peptidoglycan interpeptide bridge formation enzyme)